MQIPQEPHVSFQKAMAYYHEGNKRYSQEDYQGAIKAYIQATSINPLDWEILMNMGNAYFALQDFEKSLAIYNQALALQPQSERLFYNRANALTELGDLQQGLEAYTQAIQLSPEFAWAYGNRGQVFSLLGLHQEAIHDFDQAFTIAPNDPNTAWIWTWTHLVPQGEEAVRELRRIAQLDPRHTISPLCLGAIDLLNANPDGALDHFEQANDTLDYDTPFWKGMALAYQGKDEQAQQSIETAIARQLPPILLTPLYWLQSVNPSFFANYADLLQTLNSPHITSHFASEKREG